MKVRVKEIKNKKELSEYLKKLGNTPEGIKILNQKGKTYLFEIEGIDTRGANILKQDAISVGGDCAVPRSASAFKPGNWTVLLMVNERELKRLTEKLKAQPYGLKKLSEELRKIYESYQKEEFSIVYRGRELSLKKPTVMGILNVTPDSFSDGGKFNRVDAAVKRCEEMLKEGAKIIDVGGESTRPGSEPVPVEEELRRVVPVIEEIRKQLGSDFFISVDTYKSRVAEEALKAGADIVNDISGFRFDERMAEVVAEFQCPAVVMHIKGTPKDMQKNPYYEDVMGEILDYFQEVFEKAKEKGVDREQLIVDPGIGFGKRLVDNLCILKKLKELKVLGRPILIGASRKSFIGKITGVEVPEKRLAGSISAAVVGAMNGAKIVRVHDVKETVEALELLSAIEEAQC